MRCFYVLVHGKLEWPPDHLDDQEMFTPTGFYCHRYVLAKGYEEAADRAFRLIRKTLERQTGWIGQGSAKLTLEAHELKPAPLHKLFRRGRKVSDFYDNVGAEPVGTE